jgi:ankyrin repeat protein
MPLHVAAKKGQEEVAKLLISYGADVNARDGAGKTPIFYATENGNLKIARLLLTNKANVKDYPELLNIAVKRKRREIIEVLLQHGADVNTIDELGRTALHFTALGINGEFFGFRYPDDNVKVEIAKLLLSSGANVNSQAKNGMTTLHAAAQKGYVKIIEALLEYNADVNCTITTDIRQLSYLRQNQMFYKICLRRRHPSIVTCGSTPLHIAAQEGHLEVVKVLLNFGAGIDSTDKYGRTALLNASKARHEQIVIALLEHGSDINIMSKHNHTPLDYVRGHGILSSESIAEILEHHMIKMKTANLFLSEKNLLSISSNDEVSAFQNECEEEIAGMKSEKVGNANVSFCDILT